MILELALLGACTNPLPADLNADIGIPVAYGDDTIFLYGDTIRDGNLIARNMMIVDDTVILQPLDDTTAGTWYWPTDAVTLPDGTLFVIALEMVEGGGLGYEVTDTDGFVVNEPRSGMSWKLATKIEDGPWGDSQVQFADQHPLAFVRDPYGLTTTVYSFEHPLGLWVNAGGTSPESHGVFAPVQTADGWYGYTWEMWHTATLWHGSGPGGPWTEVETIRTDQPAYDHGLNVVDGVVCHRQSTEGRVTTEEQ